MKEEGYHLTEVKTEHSSGGSNPCPPTSVTSPLGQSTLALTI